MTAPTTRSVSGPAFAVRDDRHPGSTATLARVLVADDDPLMTQVIGAVLRQMRCEIIIARDAMQATMFAARECPDAIVLDVRMPGGSGITALRRLMSNARTHGTPVVVVSGDTDPALPAMVTQLGASTFLPKPLDLERLRETLTQLLAHLPR